jgi:superfamily II DNA or RNA helicase
MTIRRFSSRRHHIDQIFLLQRLQEAKAYDRIAGYFSSSILQIAGEVLESMTGPIRVICNSELDIRDVKIAQTVRDAMNDAMHREWCDLDQEHFSAQDKTRYSRLYNLLKSEKMQVKVLPHDKFGLEHGKAGVITLANEHRTAFIGSVNETYSGWRRNYEIVWEDDSEEGVRWVQEEFDALWNSPFAISLADFVIEDIGRIGQRTVIPSVEVWRNDPEPAAPIIETPLYRQEYGLWEHQKYFIQLAFDAHRSARSARFILADMVGLGKTIQLAVTAMLMALYGNKPILILAPRSLVFQWQQEMKQLLDMPSAVWIGKKWIDENGIEYCSTRPDGIQHCPRRVGIVSYGLVISESPIVAYLEQMTYECVIVDEAHKARRKNLGEGQEDKQAVPNNLLAFLYKISKQTKSMLLATATPVQVYPVEVWDLLNVLAAQSEEPAPAMAEISAGSKFVLGSKLSKWRKVSQALRIVMQGMVPPEHELWDWLRNPLPPGEGDPPMQTLIRALNINNTQAVLPGPLWATMDRAVQERVKRLGSELPRQRNPFILHIVRRTRQFLEEEINPRTNEPYLKAVKVVRHGESDAEGILMPSYLQEAYTYAKVFCKMLSMRSYSTGLLQTMLLRRVGSTIHAGLCTARVMLEHWENNYEDIEEELEGEKPKSLTLENQEREQLEAFISVLEMHTSQDPKYDVIKKTLLEEGWLEKGCIIFSQYLDSIIWLAAQLSRDIPEEKIGVYAGGQNSYIYVNGIPTQIDRDVLKRQVQQGEIRLLLGTDAASEGLNLQRLGALINLDLPWNPTRLEQRKGRIQRIGQLQDVIHIYNMRYKGSVEDRVHMLLSQRLEAIYTLFGQIPDILETAWVDIAMERFEEANKTIGKILEKHPFEMKYNQIAHISWESCASVLDASDRQQHLLQGWSNL